MQARGTHSGGHTDQFCFSFRGRMNKNWPIRFRFCWCENPFQSTKKSWGHGQTALVYVCVQNVTSRQGQDP